MRVTMFGTSDFAVPLLRALVQSGHQTRPVVTAPARPSGRGRKLAASPVETAALSLGLPVLSPENPNDPLFVTELGKHKPDAGVLAAYGFILKPALLDLPRYGFVNLHPSLLPRYRGAAPIQRALLAGEQHTGITVITMSERVDAGDILEQQTVEVGPDETAGELSCRLAEAGAGMVVRALANLESGTATRTVQDPALATRAPKIDRSERDIRWSQPAQQTHNRIRALSPEPGAVTWFRGVRMVLLRSKLFDASEAGEPGTILTGCPGLVVACGKGALELLEVKPEGSRSQSGQDFVNGRHPAADDRLGTP